MKNKNPTYNYSCVECAKKAGAESNGGCHTVHIGKCDLCDEQRPLWSRSDWLWPNEKRNLAQWDLYMTNNPTKTPFPAPVGCKDWYEATNKFAQRIIDIAFSIEAPNQYTPELVMMAQGVQNSLGKFESDHSQSLFLLKLAGEALEEVRWAINDRQEDRSGEALKRSALLNSVVTEALQQLKQAGVI